MTKETVQKLFKNHKNVNFCIYTNIAEGRGINGVSFTKFWGKYVWEDRDSYKKPWRYDNTKILSFEDEGIIVENSVDDEIYNSGIFELFIPYESINCIKFIKESKKFGNTL